MPGVSHVAIAPSLLSSNFPPHRTPTSDGEQEDVQHEAKDPLERFLLTSLEFQQIANVFFNACSKNLENEALNKYLVNRLKPKVQI